MNGLTQEITFEPTANGRFLLSEESRKTIHAMHPWMVHHTYHDLCRKLFKEAGNELPGSDAPAAMVERGFQRFSSLLDRDEVEALTGMIDERIAEAGPNAAKDEWGWSLPWNMIRIQSMKPTVSRIFGGELGRVLTEYFGCHFRIFSLSLTRGFPGPAQGSFTWHRDVEPPQQTHLMIYLTPSSETGGGTAFIDLAETERAARAGYDFPGDAQRVEDLEQLGLPDGDFQPEQPVLNPGDGILFGAPRILHKGILPADGHRDVLTALVIPSPVPYDEYLQRDTGRVFVRQHPGVSILEPFEDLPFPVKPLNDVPDWARKGGMFPPEYQG